jgi:hypothetical protein
MSTTPTPVPASTAQKILNDISTAGGYVSLVVGGIELVKGLVSAIKSVGSAKGTQTYQIVISTDAAELDAIVALDATEIAAINADLAQMGAPTIPVPAPIVDPLDTPPVG